MRNDGSGDLAATSLQRPGAPPLYGTARLRFRHRDKVLHRGGSKRRLHGEHPRLCNRQRDRREIAPRVERQLAISHRQACDRIRDGAQRVTIGGRALSRPYRDR